MLFNVSKKLFQLLTLKNWKNQKQAFTYTLEKFIFNIDCIKKLKNTLNFTLILVENNLKKFNKTFFRKSKSVKSQKVRGILRNKAFKTRTKKSLS